MAIRKRYHKHRLAKEHCDFDFTDQIASGDSLSGGAAVTVLKRTATGDEDVTSEFGTTNPQISGTTVVFTLNAATGSGQDAGRYKVRVEVDTAAGEHLVGEVEGTPGDYRLPYLDVTEDGGPSAP